MKVSPTLLLGMLSVCSLSACSSSAPLSRDFGRATEANIRAVVTYPSPWPNQGLAHVSSGERIAASMDRYTADRVTITPNVTASKVGATGNGAQVGQ
jgi:hypothetical protein